MQSEREWLRRWSRLAGIEPPAREAADLVGLFGTVEPKADAVERLLETIPNGRRVHRRLVNVYDASASRILPLQHAYAVVASLTQAPPDALVAARRWIDSLGTLLVADAELSQILQRVQLEWQDCNVQLEQNLHPDDDPRVWLFDAVSDILRDAADRESPLLLLREAVYSVANDLYLAAYVLWPIYADSLGCDDPFRSYFDLWARGLELRFMDEKRCFVRDASCRRSE